MCDKYSVMLHHHRATRHNRRIFLFLATSCLKLLSWFAVILKTGHLGIPKLCLGTTGQATKKLDCPVQNGTNGHIEYAAHHLEHNALFAFFPIHGLHSTTSFTNHHIFFAQLLNKAMQYLLRRIYHTHLLPQMFAIRSEVVSGISYVLGSFAT
ncbi:hypothetical protein AVEN_59818-1 [Araneus ventricosus]|uniref:Uncharacterized protein n=1 Tax=Araneus ventricosus TaxID=182803 RepID=A0A4Y2WHZ1_ARAVE|nr:hypothetical protein AVEN_21319-1 [Araneus ventricosus]GBO36611.1 hypothetical protein AVEN_59818-1 [Araneus ventricosus]